MKKKFSIVMPIYKNEQNLPTTIPYVIEHRDLFSQYDVELVMVCDGSPDRSYGIMKEYKEKYPDIIKIACFTRNFGQGAATRCGMEMAEGDVIGVISADLQDPLELFAEMLKYWEEGYPFVFGTRAHRLEKGFGVFASKTMHGLVNKYVDPRYPKGGFDFYLLDRKVAEEFIAMDAPNGSTQMALLWLGYEYKAIPYDRRERTAGKSSWKFWRKIDAASGLFITYSKLPIRLSFILAILLAIVSMLILIWSIVFAIVVTVEGLAMHILFAILFLALAAIAGMLGIMGEYIWRMFDIQKGRPRYVVKEMVK